MTRPSRSFKDMSYSKEFEVVDGMRCRFEDAGHILGSASVSLDLRSNGQRTTLAFTGDLGRPHLPILRDPVLIANDQTEYLICESTYGGRFHSPQADMEEQLLQPILRAIERRGKIVIPAFSVGRTQEIVYLLHQMSIKGKLGHIPVYVDSPLSVNVTDVFKKHPECFDEETLAILHAPENNDPFGFERLKYVRTLEESKALNDTPGPFIVISASGMCEAGRVVHHLANSVGDPNNIIMIVGYQAEHTLGKRLVMKEPVVNIFGEPHEVKAEVVVLNAFSAHADRNEMLDYLRRFPAPSAAEGLPGPWRSGPVRETRSDAHRREFRRGPHSFARDPHPARMTQAFARACRSIVPAMVLVLCGASVAVPGEHA